MMNPTKDVLTFTVSLTLIAHQIAQQFHERQSNPQKAKQVYLNTLAVYAVNYYLNCLGIETEIEASDSWNPVMQTLANTADLAVKDLGKLECRPLLPHSKVCDVPPEVLEERIGYVVVRLDQSLTEATLLGFVPTVTTEELPLNQLKSLEDLLEHLSQPHPQSVKEPIQLRQWLQNLFSKGWETMEALLEPPQAELGFSFRNPTGVQRGKLLDLERVGEKVALFVGLKPATQSEMDISIEVYPTGGQIYLPQDLQLMVLDDEGKAVMQAQARSTKTIQLKFSGELGESFGVKIALGDVSITEAFLI
ncbi:MAG TPA: DUF1822 family protein [Coleofasciculaceae cyanobacterium]|jgi:hypothetical protein